MQCTVCLCRRQKIAILPLFQLYARWDYPLVVGLSYPEFRVADLPILILVNCGDHVLNLTKCDLTYELLQNEPKHCM